VLPTGTVTFLMTDVEGSTRGWAHSPEALAEAIPRHYAILDDAVDAHGGTRPVEHGEGDSVVAAFTSPIRAIEAALQAQRALSAEQWPGGLDVRVRMRCTPEKRNYETKTTTSGWRSSAARGSGTAGTAGRCWCRRPPPR